jgi:hypothetical protein
MFVIGAGVKLSSHETEKYIDLMFCPHVLWAIGDYNLLDGAFDGSMTPSPGGVGFRIEHRESL